MSIAVQSLDEPVAIDAYFRLLVRTFLPDVPFIAGAPPHDTADLWRRSIEDAPAFQPSQLRGVLDGSVVRGAYTIYERTLCLGAARLRTGFVAGVVTHPDYRRQGIASALMHDARDYALEHDYAILLLNGLAGFYGQFGYVDTLDFTKHAISRARILAEPVSSHQVRRATRADARVLLDLYHRHYEGYPGSFTRTLEQQTHQLACRIQYDAPVLAISPDGEPSGYLVSPLAPFRYAGYEVAADSWLAALALLQHHARQLEREPEPPSDVIWVLPPDATTFYLLADHVAVRSETTQQPNAGLMARPGSLSTLMHALLPEWRARWRRHTVPYARTIAFDVDGTMWYLGLGPEDVQLQDGPGDDPCFVSFSLQVFTQLVFGYRSIAWAARQPGQNVPDALLAPLSVLFPQLRTWFAASDAV